MVTTVGTESDIRTLVTDFIQLEHDAIAAYETCIERLDTSYRRERIAEFLCRITSGTCASCTTSRVRWGRRSRTSRG
jgi:hypothetical protein